MRVGEVRRRVEAEMTRLETEVRDVATLEVARVGRVAGTGDPLRPFVVLDETGAEVCLRKCTS